MMPAAAYRGDTDPHYPKLRRAAVIGRITTLRAYFLQHTPFHVMFKMMDIMTLGHRCSLPSTREAQQNDIESRLQYGLRDD